MIQERLKGLFILHREAYEKIYGKEEISEINRYVDIYAPVQTPESIKKNPSLLNEADVIFSGWGMPTLNKTFLDNAPNLKVLFYGSGTVKYFVTDLAWERGIKITSAFAANAIPVAEFTLGQIILGLKSYWQHSREIKQKQNFISSECYGPGMYGSTVGIISLGMISRHLCQLLLPFDVKVIAYDPYIEETDAQLLNVELHSLEDVFALADVVSLHSPLNEKTEGMIRGYHFHMMKPHSTFINTARGAIVREDEMIEALKKRPDLTALLDVTYPEPPAPESELYEMENVMLTPHIAGSVGAECRRMGNYMVQELLRYISDKPLKWEITKEKNKIMA